MCQRAVRETSPHKSSIGPRARHLGQCRAREGRQTRVSSGVQSLATGVSSGPSVSWKGQVPEVSLEGTRESEGIREKELGDGRLLQTVNDQKDRCPQLHKASRPGATSCLT